MSIIAIPILSTKRIASLRKDISCEPFPFLFLFLPSRCGGLSPRRSIGRQALGGVLPLRRPEKQLGRGPLQTTATTEYTTAAAASAPSPVHRSLLHPLHGRLQQLLHQQQHPLPPAQAPTHPLTARSGRVSAQEPASVSRPGVWRGASGPMPAPYDGERRVRREGQKGPRGLLRVDL